MPDNGLIASTANKCMGWPHRKENGTKNLPDLFSQTGEDGTYIEFDPINNWDHWAMLTNEMRCKGYQYIFKDPPKDTSPVYISFDNKLENIVMCNFGDERKATVVAALLAIPCPNSGKELLRE